MSQICTVWKPISMYDGKYEASICGKIRHPNPIHKSRERSFVLTPQLLTTGYLAVPIYFRGTKKNKPVHILVADAFLGPRPTGLDINHKDGCKTNNEVENLEYVTASENTRHAVDMGLFRPVSKLQPEDVRYIRAMHGIIPLKVLGEQFGVCWKHISLIQNRKKWKWLDPLPEQSKNEAA